jgi:membrane protein YqaA with SNARE-associated domain
MEYSALVTLFISGFTSATLLPGSSEALYLLMLSDQQWSILILTLVVGTANSLGGMTNWLLGLLIRRGFYQPKHKTKQYQRLRKAESWLQRHGSPLLLFSFLPVIGDPLCLAAGLIRLPWLQVIFFITAGKFIRYFLLAFLHGAVS